MSEINSRQDEIIEEFAVFDDWMDKYSYLIETGKELKALPESDKKDNILINGCQSKVWLKAELKDGRVYYEADSDAIITKGLAALLVKVASGLPPEEIMNADFYFIEKIGLKENLSPTRSNGLTAMVKQIKMYALAYYTKLNSK